MTDDTWPGMRNLRRIKAWRRGLELVVAVYKLTRRFPREEMFCLTAQLRRAALRVPSTIGEGNERDTAADRRHFLTTSRSSLAEIETQLTAAFLLGYAGKKELR